MSVIQSNTGIAFIDEISYVALAYLLVGFLVTYIAWRSTFVRHENRDIPYRQRTVFIFNPQTGDFQQHSLGLLLNNLSAHLQAPPPTLESILDEVNGVTYHTPQRQDDTLEVDLVIEDETQEIIREMDREPNDLVFGQSDGLRNRRPTNRSNSDNHNDEDSSEEIAAAPSTISDDGSSSTTDRRSSQLLNAGSSLEDDLHIYPVINRSPTTSNAVSDYPDNAGTIQAVHVEATSGSCSTAGMDATNSKMFGNEITIKLKYLNDDLKIVKARQNEAIGDFKKRNFNEEISAQKLVRLVFNGHVLQPDTKTIAACGLFDNCVVHCLIHNPRPNAMPPQNQSMDNQAIPPLIEDGNEQIGIENLINANRNRNRNTQRLLNLSLFLICLSVIISWFFRIQYFQLFSWYSTVGLVLLTTFFLVIIPLIFLIEREIFRNL